MSTYFASVVQHIMAEAFAGLKAYDLRTKTKDDLHSQVRPSQLSTHIHQSLDTSTRT